MMPKKEVPIVNLVLAPPASIHMDGVHVAHGTHLEIIEQAPKRIVIPMEKLGGRFDHETVREYLKGVEVQADNRYRAFVEGDNLVLEELPPASDLPLEELPGVGELLLQAVSEKFAEHAPKLDPERTKRRSGITKTMVPRGVARAKRKAARAARRRNRR